MQHKSSGRSTTTTQTEAYVKNRGVKQHEHEMLALVASHYDEQQLFTVLDIGCADGLFCEILKQRFPFSRVTGIDMSTEMIAQAESRNIADSQFTISDVMEYDPKCKYDVIVASGILSAFQDFSEVLETWLKWLKKDGVIFVFGRFNSENIDTQIKFRNNYNNSDWEGGYSAYSIHTVGKFLEGKGLEHHFKKFNLNINLPKSDNPVVTYTLNTIEGEKLIINGANLVAEFYFLTIKNID